MPFGSGGLQIWHSSEERALVAEEFTIVSHGMLGYGFPKSSLDEAVRRGFGLVAIDAGSTDPGPFYLGSGRPFVSATMVERDLELLIDAAHRARARVVIGSAGGAGTRSQLEFVVGIVKKILARQGRTKTTIATIDSELDKTMVKAALASGRIRTFETGRALTGHDIDAATHIVAQIGLEPVIAALQSGADIVISGRAWDVTNVAALPVMLGYHEGLALHLGKILECGGQAALPVEGSDLLMGRIYPDHFIIETPHASKACTIESVSAHTLYEKSNPVWLPGPGGIVDLREVQFEQIDPTRVKVRGSQFRREKIATVKLEGARFAGHRHVTIAGMRDPLAIAQIEEICDAVTARLKANLAGSAVSPDAFSINFRRYGVDGVMGALEPVKARPHEIGLIIDVVGQTPEIAETVCGMARSLTMHWGYRGRIATAGNLAVPFSPADFPAGEVYEFNVYHLMEVDDPAGAFPFKLETI